jgi:TonB family protein
VWLIAGLYPLTGGLAAPVGEVVIEDRSPMLVRPLSINIPYDLWHILQPDATATVILRIDIDGKVLEWVSLDLPHPKLIAPIDRALARAEFLPGLVGDEPAVSDILAHIPVGKIGCYGILTITPKEYLEARIAAINPHEYRMNLSLPGEIDRPLRMVSKGNPIGVVDEGGNVLEGEVIVEFHIDQDGRPRIIRPDEGPHPSLREAAILMVREIRFEPPLRKGRPTVVKVRMPVVFGG